MTSSALKKQIGGDHYKIVKIQPFELTLANFGYAGLRATIYNKVNKYLLRDKGDHFKHIEDIEKAIHCLEYQLEEARNVTRVETVDQAEERSHVSDSYKWAEIPVPTFRKTIRDL